MGKTPDTDALDEGESESELEGLKTLPLSASSAATISSLGRIPQHNVSLICWILFAPSSLFFSSLDFLLFISPPPPLQPSFASNMRHTHAPRKGGDQCKPSKVLTSSSKGLLRKIHRKQNLDYMEKSLNDIKIVTKHNQKTI